MRVAWASVIGTRPEIIRLSRVMARFDQFMEQTIVHTGQNYDYSLNEVFFRDLEIRKPDCFLSAACATPAETIGRVIGEADKVLAKIAPDAFLVLGDTNSCLAAIAPKRRRILVFHMEAGNRCFDLLVPEEINRRIVDVVADVNLTYSTIARQFLLAEEFPPDRVIKTGSPMFEVPNYYRPAIQGSQIVRELGLEKYEYLLVSAHREENVDPEDKVLDLMELPSTLGDRFDEPVVVSTHPRTRNRIEKLNLPCHCNVRLLSRCSIFSNRMNDRRAFEEASVMLTGLNCERLLQKQPRGDRRLLGLVGDYAVPNVSDKVLRLILSYTEYVRRTVWHQY